MNQDVELTDIKREKAQLKQKWSNAFLNELDKILEKCFLKPKNKKEHFITKEKIEVDIIKLMQSQNRFAKGENFRTNLNHQAIFDKVENAVAKILTINCKTKQIEALNIFQQVIVRDFDDVIFFDIYSIEFAAIFEKQKIIHSIPYGDTYRFLTHVPPKEAMPRAAYHCVECVAEKLVIPIDYSK